MSKLCKCGCGKVLSYRGNRRYYPGHTPSKFESYNFLNPTIPEHAYIIGLYHSDGTMCSLPRRRGRAEIWLKKTDGSVLRKIQKILPYRSRIRTRTRRTNFSKKCSITGLRICSLGFREELLKHGMHYGKKSGIIKPPKSKYIEKDYWRGMIDGDGSVGITANNIPFISFFTTSESIAAAFSRYLRPILGYYKTTRRNKRDEAFNFMIQSEEAQRLVSHLYYTGCLGISRKVRNAQKVLRWKRPKSRLRSSKVPGGWNIAKNKILLSNSLKQSQRILGEPRYRLKAKLSQLNRSCTR